MTKVNIVLYFLMPGIYSYDSLFMSLEISITIEAYSLMNEI